MSTSGSPRQNAAPPVVLSRQDLVTVLRGETFADALDDPAIPIDEVLAFFNDAGRQQRLEDAEIHHDRAPLAGVVRELEARPDIQRLFAQHQRRRSMRLRQVIGVVVRLVMEGRGWQPTGRIGALGLRGTPEQRNPHHNLGGLALWFIRAERYDRDGGMPFPSVRERCEALGEPTPTESAGATNR